MENYEYMVWVSCLTYNHSSYIEDALNGFCMQETSFPFVCGIMEDFSTDGEQTVIRKYLQDHFNLTDDSIVRNEETEDFVLTFAQHKTNKNCYFAVLFLKYNHYQMGKSRLPYIQEWLDKSKYIAVCEGDDYWVDSQKLQLQVDFLETHPDYSATAHQSKLIGAKTGCFYEGVPEIVTMNDILSNARLFHTASVVYRLKDYMELPPMKMPYVSGDKLTFLKLSFLGLIKYFDKCMCVYRVHSGGVHSTVKLENLKNDRNIMIYMKSIDPRFPKFRFLSFLYGTFAMYPSDITVTRKVYFLVVSFVLSFSYFPSNIRDISKKIQRYRNYKTNKQ